jgi:hypothetical protein
VPTTVAILGGDPVVAQTLELLLQGSGYRTRLLSDLLADDPDGPLGEAQLLLIVPGLRLALRERIYAGVKSAPGLAKTPILQLVAAREPGRGKREYRIPWPCRVEELKRRNEDALLAG